MKRMLLIATLSAIFAIALAACGGSEAPAAQIVEVEKEVFVDKIVLKEVPVEVVVEKEVIKEIKVPGETVVVTKEVAPPRGFSESPLLTQLVQAGKLPPVEERLPIPSDVMVIQTYEQVGKYGGTMRRALIGPGDVSCNVGRVNGMSPFRFTTEGELMPHVVKGVEPNADGTVWTFSLREGMRWSDGAPFTADNWVWAWEDLGMNEDLKPSKSLWVRGPGPETAVVAKVDDTTFTVSYPKPYWVLPAAWGWLCAGPWIDPYMPSHYLEQFHTKYNPDAEKMAKEAGFDSWIPYFLDRHDVRDNPDRPTVQPWVMQNKRGDHIVWTERNPYYFATDQKGNQLPYIDKQRFETVENVDLVMLKAVQGEIDFQSRHIQLPSLPVLKQSADKGGYRIQLYPTYGGVDAYLGVNHSYPGPAGDLLRNKDFRIALSFALNRDFTKEVSFLGFGKARNAIPPLGHPHHPGAQYETLNVGYDLDKSNSLLDKVMGPKDGDGFRTLPDGSRFELDVNATAAFGPWPDIAEQAAQFWMKVGIRSRSEVVERSLYCARGTANEQMVSIWNHDYTANVFSQPQKSTPVNGGGCEPHWGPGYGVWWSSSGDSGVKPTPEVQQLMDWVTEGSTLPPAEAAKVAQKIYAWHAENQVLIGVIGHSPMVQGVTVVNRKLVNVPDKIANDSFFNTPFTAFPEQLWYRD